MSPSSSALKPYFNIGGGGGGGGGEGIGGETPKPMGTRARLQTPSCLWLMPANTDEFVTVPFTTDHLHVICTICQLKMRTLPPLLADEL